ncbi:hypothetical protein [Chitinimonas sp. BJYL2]|uniref:hypothetical protein n=1 Tax=Chitinimonas sp. BJYL2 TaxID=2976696 RepID=UPI0022B2E8D9|nr:hypothetical protein [Chitinimonas sp. BJYL2]
MILPTGFTHAFVDFLSRLELATYPAALSPSEYRYPDSVHDEGLKADPYCAAQAGTPVYTQISYR